MPQEPIKIVNHGHPVTTDVFWHGQQTNSVLSVDLTGDGIAHGVVLATLQVVAEVDVYATYTLLDVLSAWNALAEVWPQAGHAPAEKVRPARVHLVAPSAAVLRMLLRPDGGGFRWIGVSHLHLEHDQCRADLVFPTVEVAWPPHFKQGYADELRLLIEGMQYEGVR